MSASTLAEQLGVRRLPSRNTNGEKEAECYVSTHYPGRMGNALPIAYGGCTVSIAIHAACQSVWSQPQSPSSDYKLYSSLGHFLGPALIDRVLSCEVSSLRDSRSFKTRRVVVTQTYDEGSVRECLELTADFMRVEKEVEMVYSAPPFADQDNYSESAAFAPRVDRTASPQELAIDVRDKGQATEEEFQSYQSAFALGIKLFENRICRDGVSGQNLNGAAKSVRSSQHQAGLSITDKTSSQWIRTHQPLETEAEDMAALAFNMDGSISFLPLVHAEQGKFLDDVGPCSTLDFALRVFQTGQERMDMRQWKLKEWRTICAAGGRTYGEARLWDEKGNLTASMTQACIMRPKPKAKKADKL